MKSAEEKLIEALEAYVAFRESDETWAAAFRADGQNLRAKFTSDFPHFMERTGILTEYAQIKGRQPETAQANVDLIASSAADRSIRLGEHMKAQTNALERLLHVLEESR